MQLAVPAVPYGSAGWASPDDDLRRGEVAQRFAVELGTLVFVLHGMQ